MPRLGYSKSRTGCKRCRQRRVKCDEKRPCSACHRHGLVCSLVEDGSPGSEVSQSSNPRVSAPVEAAKAKHTPPPEAGPGSGGDDWVTDLELMHHYNTKAYLTLPRADEVGDIWRDKVPELAFRHRYLLHHILAMSAFHLAYLRPDEQRRYYCMAAHHQSQGIGATRAALESLDVESCHALFMAGSFLALGGFAALAVNAQEETTRTLVEDAVETFGLLKGMSAVLLSWEKTLHDGPFAKLFDLTPPHHSSLSFWNDMNEGLIILSDHLAEKLVGEPSTFAIVNQELLGITEISKHSLETSTVPELRFIMHWPSVVSNAYINLLRARSPAALTLLSYYCVVVHATESMTWFTRGWATRLIKSIETILPPDWGDAIEWPIKRILKMR
ncbi:hypothetical protein GQ53DRAFT_696849 [Thozetella sp. PMI_491]|nr:hypothetical protein GQ53DRAFT_696849 [Thozetella sp. PMI_491]